MRIVYGIDIAIRKVVEFSKENETYLPLMPEEAVSNFRKPELGWYTTKADQLKKGEMVKIQGE